jgi:hypothetical protein
VDDVQVRTFLQWRARPTSFRAFQPRQQRHGIGDVNADGIDDAAIVDAGASTGQIYFLFGGARGQGVGRRFPRSVRRRDAAAGDRESFNGFRIKPAGNVDGDFADSNGNGQRDPGERGFDDVIIAGADTSYVVFGGPPLTTVDTPVSMTTLLGQTPKQAVKLNTGSVFALGDSNGDGFGDLGAFVISTYPTLDETSQDRHGVGHVFYGHARDSFNPTAPDLVLEPAASDFGLFVNAGLFENDPKFGMRAHGDGAAISLQGLGRCPAFILGKPLPALPRRGCP